MRSSSGSTPPTAACACSPSARPRRSSASTFWRSATRTLWAGRSSRGGRAPPPAPLFPAPATAYLAEARDWFVRFEGAGLDGVVAKPLDGTYQPDKRTMFKVKHERTADCVVAGLRWHKTGPVVGSLLLGLYRDDGSLQH